jgi:metal-responsive CopG/Arc/MetJ family transcriptional regulator
MLYEKVEVVLMSGGRVLVVVEMPEVLRAALDEAARREHRTRSHQVRFLLSRVLGVRLDEVREQDVVMK